MALLAIISLLYLASLSSHLYPYGDNATYMLLSRGIIEHNHYCVPSQAPCSPHTKFPFLFPLMLAPITAVWGFNVVLMNLLTTAAAIGTVWLLYCLFRSVFGERTAIFLMAAVGLSPHISEYSHRVLSEFPFMFLTTGGLLAVRRYGTRDSTSAWQGTATGLLLAAAALTRTVGVATVAAAVVSLLLDRRASLPRKIRVAKATVLLLAAGIPVALWSVRNALVPGDSGGGYLSFFVLRDMYTPELGSVTLRELADRAARNLGFYGPMLASVVASARFVKGIEGWPLALLTGILCMPVVIGLLLPARGEGSLLRLVTAAHLLVILLYVPETRLLVPILPLLMAYFLAGVASVFTPSRSLWAVPAVAVAVLSIAIVAWGLSTQFWSRPSLAAHQWIGVTITGVVAAALLARALRRSLAVGAGVVVAAIWLISTLSWHVQADVLDEHKEPFYYRAGVYWGEFHDMARWIRANTPADARVMCRKPNLMAIWSEREVTVYPFTSDESQMLSAIAESGADYVFVDSFKWTDTTSRYLRPVIDRNPDVFAPVHRIGKSALFRLSTGVNGR